MSITYTWRYVDVGSVGLDSLACVLACQGKKHLAHQQCDLTCDKACTTLHTITLKPIVWGRRNEFSEDLVKKIYTKSGDIKADRLRLRMIGHWGDDAMKNAADSFRKGDLRKKMTYNYKSGHWNEKPCSSSSRVFKYRIWEVRVKWTVTFRDGTSISGDSLMSTLEIPEHKYFPGNEIVQCKCAIAQRYGMAPSGSMIELRGTVEEDPGNNTTNPGGVFIDPKGMGEYAFATGDDYEVYNVKFECQDLNTFTISAMNPTWDSVIFAVLPGTQLESADSGYQDMQSITRVEFVLSGMSSISVSVPVSGPAMPIENETEPFKGRVACLNMDKKEPRPGIEYTPTISTDSRLTQLAYYAAAQRFRGPWDQARLWIYTDAATRDEINKRLFPPITEGRYLQGLYDLHRVAMGDMEDVRYRQCMDPALLIGQSAPKEATAWFIDTMSEMNPSGLASWIKRNPGAFAHLFASDAEEWYLDHGVTVANRLCSSGNNEVAVSGLDFIMRAVPESGRAAFEEKGGLDQAGLLLTADDVELVAAELGVFEVYRPLGTRYLLMNMDESLPEEVRERAAQLLAELEPPT
ncbi:MAG: hypothetical protein IH851_09370 [Armatimonadetes bacterium]|nr:hypothetical protein [Armatimonadota bacterium]